MLSSPFGLRCHNIHDPLVVSNIISWLPHSDIPVHGLSTDLMVDKSFHQNLSTFNQQNPLVHNLLWDRRPSIDDNARMMHSEPNKQDILQVEWQDTYLMVCNIPNFHGERSKYSTKVSELERLCIASRMSYGSSSIHMKYVYKPKHLVYGELCMEVRNW